MRRLAILFIIPIIGLSLMGGSVSGWKLDNHGLSDGRNTVDSTATPAPTPTVTPVILAGTTTPDRILPPIGGNAGLVLGASVLVLIIIGGVVLTSRRKSKH